MKMKIESILFVCLIIFCFSVLSFSRNKTQTMIGNILSCGNYPFNYPVFVCDNQTQYRIDYTDEKQKNEYLKLQGNHLEVKAVVFKDKTLLKNTIIITSYKKIN